MDDPTLKIKENKETGEILLGGMGELHLEVSVQRMEREFLTKVKLGSPQVAYKETIKETVIGKGKVLKDSAGQYGEVTLKVTPQKRGKGFKFEPEVKEWVPQEFIEGIKKGVEENLGVGILVGFPVVDLEVKVIEIKYHAQHSSQIAFEMAGAFAMKDALNKGKIVLLEPEMKLEIVVPPEYLGSVLEDLNKRGSKVISLIGEKVHHIILAICPLRKLFGYATTLRSITQGKGIHVMKFETYKEVPEEEEEELLKKLRGY
jgi:elongation factor G